MKLVTGIVTSLVIGSLSFGVFAAKELEKDKVAGMNLTKIGTISTSDETAPMDAKRELSKKADEMGGTYYVITSADKKTQDIRATADVYK
ncbi:YdgH/BhsA/McbA-like domain containing protein [Enterobacter sp. Colony194]|uniref:YdgH/BhsA/McbA-like domain containing protein n=1 Tax=Enterobacter sp. Colony194 TaxID=2866201 RepID=UPI001C6A1C3B|nr:YdgH/BhsA/McbA-like domain containing protein [Enterobacter sp. Colony194]